MMSRVLQFAPHLTMTIVRQRTPYRRAEDIERMMEALRLAGVPG